MYACGGGLFHHELPQFILGSPPPVNRITDVCTKSITLVRTSLRRVNIHLEVMLSTSRAVVYTIHEELLKGEKCT